MASESKIQTVLESGKAPQVIAKGVCEKCGQKRHEVSPEERAKSHRGAFCPKCGTPVKRGI